jgi:hypothetical protein
MAERVLDAAEQPAVASAAGYTSLAPAATARSISARGSAEMSSIRTVPPPSEGGLKLACAGDSSATQNQESPTESWATTGSWTSVPPTRYRSTAPNAVW